MDVDLWLFVALLLSCFVINIRHRVKIPTSALLMLAGICLRTVGQYLGMLESAVKVMDNIEAETIMLIFIPALIFECAFSTEWYTFKRELGQIVLLATTAVVLASILTAVVVRYVLGFQDEFSWYEALMLGAILSATDHVAVVAQLKEVNADYRLETLIRGETLANEGSVIVVFTTMMTGAVKSEVSSGAIAELFFRLSLGGIALGLAFGLGVSIWLKRLINHPVLETLLTFITTYLLFYTADTTSLHFSGALGTVTFGLYMSAYGKTLISPLVERTVHEFWSLLGTCMESLILVLGGMLMGHFFMDFERLETSDIGALFALFVLLHVVRGVTVFVHWPLLRLMGYGCSFKEMLVLITGALKGTISIALALIVFHNKDFAIRVRDLVLFWSVGVSALSAIFDSLLLRYVVHWLGLESMTDVQENMLMSVTTSIIDTTNKKITTMKGKAEFSMANWEEVLKAAGPQTLFFDMMRATKNGKKLLKTNGGEGNTDDVFRQFSKVVNITDKDIVLETRRRYYTTLKGLYWHQFEHGLCFGGSTLILREAANRGLDSEGTAIKDWDFVARAIYPRRIMQLLHTLSRIPLLGRFFKSFEYDYIVQAYDVCRNFIRAHEEAEELLDDMEIDIKKEIFEEVMKEPHLQIELAKQFLAENIMDIYPEVYIFVQTKQACRSLLYSEQSSIEDAFAQGVITELEYTELLSSVKRKITALQTNTGPKVPTLAEMLRACYLLKTLPEDQFALLLTATKDEIIRKGTVLFADQAEIKGVYIVLKGRVRETAGADVTIDHYPGDVVGVQYLFPLFHRTHTAAETLITSNIAFVALPLLRELMQTEDFERKVWMQGVKRVIIMKREDFGPVGLLDLSNLNTILTNSTLEKFQKGQDAHLDYGSLVLNGGFVDGVRAFGYVEGRAGLKAKALDRTVLLKFTEELGKYVQAGQIDFRRTISKFGVQGKAPRLKLGVKLSLAQSTGVTLVQKLLPGLLQSMNKPASKEAVPEERKQGGGNVLRGLLGKKAGTCTPVHSARSSLAEDDVGKLLAGKLRNSGKEG